jgi:hypothetical protein
MMAASSGLVVSTFYSLRGHPYSDSGIDEISKRFSHAAQYGYTVTHWMPLPAAPDSATSAGGE